MNDRAKVLVQGRAMLRNVLNRLEAGHPPQDILADIERAVVFLDSNQCPVRPSQEQRARLEAMNVGGRGIHQSHNRPVSGDG